jgi:hypothetical protein
MRSSIPWDGVGETATERAARGEAEFTVAEGIGDDRIDLGHARQQRRRPVRGQDLDARRRMVLLEQGEQRLGEDGVADPGRSDDKNLHGRDRTRNSQ